MKKLLVILTLIVISSLVLSQCRDASEDATCPCIITEVSRQPVYGQTKTDYYYIVTATSVVNTSYSFNFKTLEPTSIGDTLTIVKQ